MKFELSLRRPLARSILAVTASLVCALFLALTVSQFVVGALKDPRTTLTKSEISAAAHYFSDSAPLQALLAEAELAEAADHRASADRAEMAAIRAVNLSPARYDFHLLLATAREFKGDRDGAELALREALTLAPHRTELHWRLANLLLRNGKLDEALTYFNRAVSVRPMLLQQTLALVWDVSDGRVEMMEAAVGETLKARIDLAFFLLKHQRISEAVDIYRKITPTACLDSSECGEFINGLIAIGQLELARQVWGTLIAEHNGVSQPLLWNGGFETNLRSGWTQFDWGLASNRYAQITIDPTFARTGARSLKIDFTGIDTTRIDGEIKQQVLVRPGARYRLSCFVKSVSLATPEGPRLVVTSVDSTTLLAASDPIAAGSSEWQPLSVEFTVPVYTPTVLITIKRVPKFSYDDPTRGTIWFDDFTLTELGEGK